MSKNTAIVIGSGFAGLSVGSYLAKEDWSVTIFEKNSSPGGRARKFEAQGFQFDMGPSWYWMPDVFESYFESFGKRVEDYYQLKRLDPSYRVFFEGDEEVDIPASFEELCQLFESIEAGSSQNLVKFLREAEYKYEVGINDLVYKPGRSLLEFVDRRVITGIFRLQLFSSLSAHIRKYFKDPRILQLLEFPVLFLGAMPSETPALYSLMNYADIKLGTWYPKGGMFEIVHAMVSLAEEIGVKIETSKPVSKIIVREGRAVGVEVEGEEFFADVIISSGDYHHTEQKLLEKGQRNYSEKYWESRTMAPSSLLYYLGLNKKIEGLQHHNLFFDADFTEHARNIYKVPDWPKRPLFYASVTSKSDASVAPPGHENLFILIPTAPGLKDTEEVREHYFQEVMNRMERRLKQKIRDHVIFRRDFAYTDFVREYNSFKGNAYGLANTLAQTAILKPSIINKKVKNLYYTGQLTVPGPGVPPSLISGNVVANYVFNSFRK